MPRIVEPRTPFLRVLGLAMRVYLALALVGCASTRPRPTIEEARTMETRTYLESSHVLMSAALDALQDLGYTPDETNTDLGMITASRQTQAMSGEILEEKNEDGGMPAWAIVALILTGVILIVLIASAFGGDDDEDEKKKKKDEEREKERERERLDHDHGHVAFTPTVESYGPDSQVYRYRVTIRVEAVPDGASRIRVSSQGAHYVNGSLDRAGPVHDPAFFHGFFTGLEGALRVRVQDDAREP